MITIAAIETAIIARLTSQLPYLRTCESVGEYLRHDIEELTIMSPAAYVVYEGGEYSHQLSVIQDRSMRFLVIVTAQNLRGGRTATHGSGADKGAYDLIDDVRAALTNQTCGLAIDPLLPTEETALDGSEIMAIYGITFKTRCRG